jgi:hypothetical protein
MAVLSAPKRASILKELAQYMSDNRLPFNVSKPDLIAAVNAIDDWADANALEFNAAIPQPARGLLTAKEKAQLLKMVLDYRFKETA